MTDYSNRQPANGGNFSDDLPNYQYLTATPAAATPNYQYLSATQVANIPPPPPVEYSQPHQRLTVAPALIPERPVIVDPPSPPRDTRVPRIWQNPQKRRWILIGGGVALILLLLLVAVAIILSVTLPGTGSDNNGQTTYPTAKTTTMATTDRTTQPIHNSSATTRNYSTAATVPSTPHLPRAGCILLLGGSGHGDGHLVEFYHPSQKCDVSAIDDISTVYLKETTGTSGCFLVDPKKIMIREAEPNKPPLLYGLDGTVKELQLPTNYRYRWDSTTAAVDNSSCISCGGVLWQPRSDCYRYDANSMMLQIIDSLPQPCSASASVSLSDMNFYVIGGSDKFGPRAQLYQHNGQNNVWEERKSMTKARSHHAATVLSRAEFIVCGGVGSDSQTLNDCEIYSANSNTWRHAGNLNQPRNNFSMVTFEGHVYALGGNNDRLDVMESVEKYDSTKNRWEMLNVKLATQRMGFIAVVV